MVAWALNIHLSTGRVRLSEMRSWNMKKKKKKKKNCRCRCTVLGINQILMRVTGITSEIGELICLRKVSTFLCLLRYLVEVGKVLKVQSSSVTCFL